MNSQSKIQVHKFGGASLKDASGFRNVASVISAIKQEHKNSQLLVVVSALGKTTNLLEDLAFAFFNKKQEECFQHLSSLRISHVAILDELFENNRYPVYNEISNCFTEIEWVIEDEPHDSYDFVYDQIVSIGELLSSKILTAWLRQSGIENYWLDARDFIVADNTYREGVVDMGKSCAAINSSLRPLLTDKIVLTQGFIGSTTENYSITLGREGSDYSAAIFAHCLDASSLTVWKDVPGIMNADPSELKDAKVLPQLSYSEATELAYYGATVIHPKTLKPLQSKNIELKVKSFKDLSAPGTLVNERSGIPEFPSYIFKKNQLIVTLQTPDNSFILENHLSHIFKIFAACRVKINMMENSALRFSAVIDEGRNGDNFNLLLSELSGVYIIKYNTGLTLLTVRNYLKDVETAYNFIVGHEMILESRTRHNIQFVYRKVTHS